jgi:hypothetical protein
MRPWLRIALAALAAPLVWLVAERPAHAAAWQCDERGAANVAKAPKLQMPQASLDAPAKPSCLDYLLDDARYERDRAPAPSADAAPDLAPVPFAGLVPAATYTDPPRDLFALPAPPSGVRRSLDRPPRA